MSVQISTNCIQPTNICSGYTGCGNGLEMAALARVIPVFTGEPWDSTRAYEALTVVEQPDGTMYITKSPTPAGTPLTEAKYWAVYNANMFRRLDALEARINQLERMLISTEATYTVGMLANSTITEGRLVQAN